MSLKACALCDVELTTKNDSKEHIIPNSIGGRRKIRGFLCISCNNGAGATWDVEIARQCQFLSLSSFVSRDKGEVPSLTLSTGTSGTVILHANGQASPGKPSIQELDIDGSKQVVITARSVKEAIKMAKGLTRKYPLADIDQAIAEARQVSFYLNDSITSQFSFGGKEAGKSIVKTCLALAAEAGVIPQNCKDAQLYLRNDAEACFGYYYQNDLILNRPTETVFHCVAIHGNPEAQVLIGYVEYFSCVRLLVCLSSSYQGPEVKHVYALDPSSGRELDLNLSIPFSKGDIQSIYNYDNFTQSAMTKSLDQVLRILVRRNYEREKERVIDEELTSFFAKINLKEGELLTESQTKLLLTQLANKMASFILAHRRVFPLIQNKK